MPGMRRSSGGGLVYAAAFRTWSLKGYNTSVNSNLIQPKFILIPKWLRRNGRHHAQTNTKEGQARHLRIEVVSLFENNGEDLEGKIQDA